MTVEQFRGDNSAFEGGRKRRGVARRIDAIVFRPLILALAISIAALGCTYGRRMAALRYGIGVADEIWTGVYQVPGTEEVGSIVAEFHQFADLYSGQFSFKNETYNFQGSGELQGQLTQDESFELSGTITDPIQGVSALLLNGKRDQDTMEGNYQQAFGGRSISGVFLLVRLSKTTYVAGFRSHKLSAAGQELLDLGADPSGLLGPARANAYGPGIHSDSTGRPFRWRADDGAMSFGEVRPNVYGPGIGSDATGRPVYATPLW